MESVGAFFDEEFDFLKLFTNVDDDFLLSDPADNFCQNFDISPQVFLPETTNSNIMAHNFYLQSFDSHNIESYVSHESSNSSGSEIQGYFPNECHEDKQDNNVDSFLTLPNDSNNTPEFMHFLAMDTQNVGDANVLSDATHQEVTTVASGSLGHLKRKLDAANQKSCNDSSAEAPKKKPRAPRNTQKNKKSNKGQTKKNKKIVKDNISDPNDDDKNESTENNGGKQIIHAPNSSMSEDDLNAFEEINGEVVTTSECNDSSFPNSKGKTRAARGNATDPQSLYARKRRERINERLRVLQNLVPNGTKVDISTMLEEAVQYVKFLQLQIQLLSSDDMWMFAPLAFNGIDVGVYQRMFPNL